MNSKYLEFKLIEEKPKTKVYELLSKLHGFRLGIIKWYPNWRQYSFFPSQLTVFNNQCLNEIVSFISDLKKEKNKL